MVILWQVLVCYTFVITNDFTNLIKDSEGLIHLWDIGTGRRIKTMRGHRGNIYSLSFSRESTVLVSGGSDCTVRAWDVFKTNYNNPVPSSLTGSVVTPFSAKTSTFNEVNWSTRYEKM